MFKSLCFLTVLLAMCQAQIFSFGPCPVVTVKQNFVLSSYLGKWYELFKYPNTFQGMDQKCTIANYTLVNGTVTVVNTQLSMANMTPTSITGSAVLDSTTAEGKLAVSFPSAPFPAPYWILDTDYTSYSVIYSCINFFLFNLKYVWVMSRTRLIMPQTAAIINSVLDANKLDRVATTLIPTDQILCPLTW